MAVFQHNPGTLLTQVITSVQANPDRPTQSYVLKYVDHKMIDPTQLVDG